MIIGVIGQSGSGKDTFADYLYEHYGVDHLSLSNLLRQKAKKHFGSEDIDRRQMSEFGDLLRKSHSKTYIIDEALTHATKDVVISGIYAVAEAERLKSRQGVIVAIESSPRFRYERISQRGHFRDRAIQTYEEFLTQSQKELGTGGYEGRVTVKDADVVIKNDASLIEFYRSIDQFMQRYGYSDSDLSGTSFEPIRK